MFVVNWDPEVWGRVDNMRARAELVGRFNNMMVNYIVIFKDQDSCWCRRGEQQTVWSWFESFMTWHSFIIEERVPIPVVFE